MSDRRTTYRARLDQGFTRFFTASGILLVLAGLWFWATTEAPSMMRALGIVTPILLAVAGLAFGLRRELSVGRYGLEIAFWPIPISLLRLARPEILVVAIVKRKRWMRRQEVWDVVVQTRSGHRPLSQNHPDDAAAEKAAAAIRAALS